MFATPGMDIQKSHPAATDDGILKRGLQRMVYLINSPRHGEGQIIKTLHPFCVGPFVASRSVWWNSLVYGLTIRVHLPVGKDLQGFTRVEVYGSLYIGRNLLVPSEYVSRSVL